MRRKRRIRMAESAYEILNKNQKPMTYIEITDEALKTIEPNGKTPSQSFRVAMARDPRFVRTSKGTYALAEWKNPEK